MNIRPDCRLLGHGRGVNGCRKLLLTARRAAAQYGGRLVGMAACFTARTGWSARPSLRLSWWEKQPGGLRTDPMRFPADLGQRTVLRPQAW